MRIEVRLARDHHRIVRGDRLERRDRVDVDEAEVRRTHAEHIVVHQGLVDHTRPVHTNTVAGLKVSNEPRAERGPGFDHAVLATHRLVVWQRDHVVGMAPDRDARLGNLDLLLTGQ